MKQTHMRINCEDKPKLDELPKKLGCASIPEALSVLLKNINEKSIIRVLDEDLPKLQQIMSEKGFRDLAFVVHYILDKAQDEVKLKTVTIDSIMESNVPFVLTSPPKTGKTTFCKKLIDSPYLLEHRYLLLT